MIRHPNAILGNDKLLVSMGEKGNLLGFFYPRRDWAQHIGESKACIYTNGGLLWTDSPEWTSKQEYVDDTNVITTHLPHFSGIEVSIHDFMHQDMPVLVRKYGITSKEHISGKFYYYSNFQAGENHRRNSAFCDLDAGLLVQYMQNFYIGLSSAPGFEEWQVGKIQENGWVASAISDMEDGQLQQNVEDIGDLDNSIGWELNLLPGESTTITLFIGIASERQSIYDLLADVLEQSPADIMHGSEDRSVRWLSKKRALDLSVLEDDPLFKKEVHSLYVRSLLSLNLLNDPEEGSFVASPEFDPAFEMCGGYGFCWNRDTVEIVLALLNAGYPEFAAKFFEWCKRTQLPNGSWFQRYWLDGKEAPSWGNFDDSTQIDETGSTLYAIDHHYQKLEVAERPEFLETMWETVREGAEYLMGRTVQGLHDPCRCLWESEIGIFSYTNAAIYAGLKGAAHLAKENGVQIFAEKWFDRAELVRKETIEKLWLKEGYFSRGIIDNNIHRTVDSSMIGTFIPFALLSSNDPDEKAMILSMIEHIESALRVPVNGYFGIKRYENDNYIDGNPWVVTTLWLSRALLTLAISLGNKDDEYDLLVNKALEYIKWTIRSTTSTGLLSEQVDKTTGRAAWARPLGWSCALFIENALLLNELKEA
ncbi:glycoside hydrolase family 15 protein [Methanococcoides seepicolus]|uniref:Glucan 1,4-alpha-glucosidase n=1 Tax=Methanococcoides seepicolus TaxID=2828780 RepID=A0A9E4ZIT8_9EURY|nr:glycoside hydrolase family 15 protein [Methanococcoides seepicolus]MCM1987454.1 glucan 1,4-alpha-glucosidase [Methanococcoides seepicolus]